MRREQLEHAIRTACQVIEHGEVIVLGSQAILGTYTEAQLPVEATMSLEVDVLPCGDDEAEIERLGDAIEGAAGEFSAFDEAYGFYIDAIGVGTAVLPQGWRDRLVRIQNANTAAPGGAPRLIGWCLDKEDLCAAKLCAHREKDLRFVAALITAGLVDAEVIVERLAGVSAEHAPAAGLARTWLTARAKDAG